MELLVTYYQGRPLIYRNNVAIALARVRMIAHSLNRNRTELGTIRRGINLILYGHSSIRYGAVAIWRRALLSSEVPHVTSMLDGQSSLDDALSISCRAL